MEGCEDIFPTVFTMRNPMLPKTTRELRMMRLSQEIREREEWMEMMDEKVIVDCWKKEINEDNGFVEYIFDELKYYAERNSGRLRVGAIDGTWQVDSGWIDNRLQRDFKKYVNDFFENLDESQKDYHPWCNQQVVDFVHPSLFCYVRGLTKVNKLNDRLDYIEDEVAPLPAWSEETEHLEITNETTDKYLWLPSDVHVDPHGTVSINSYINNLHPKKHRRLYYMIVKIFEKFVPLFNRVLTDLLNIRQNRLTVDCFNWYKTKEGNNTPDSCVKHDSENADDKEFDWPEVPKFIPPETKKVVVVKGLNLQVVVKLTSIQLTPEEPSYAGGVWHVEGIESEAIVATGIFYYSSSNITESRLFFRQGIDSPCYEFGDARGLKEFYGLESGDSLNQEIGSIVCREERCFAFPNIYQHKVGPFELVDKTKVGHRKILVFCLVNPTKRVLSTKHVAPQQREWHDNLRDLDLNSTMSLEDARMYREKLMMTRKFDLSKMDEYDLKKPHSVFEHKVFLR